MTAPHAAATLPSGTPGTTAAVGSTAGPTTPSSEPSSEPLDEPAIGERVESRDGFLIGTVAGVRPASRDSSTSYLLVTRKRFFGMVRDTYLVPRTWVQRRAAGARYVTLSANIDEVVGAPRLRPDGEIRADVAEALWSGGDRPLRARIRVSVAEGIVHLSGTTRSPRESGGAVEAGWRVPGVLGVVSHLYDDETLTYAVARALTRDPETRRARLLVRSQIGAIDLGGEVPSAAALEKASALVWQVPGVASLANGAAIRRERAGSGANGATWNASA